MKRPRDSSFRNNRTIFMFLAILFTTACGFLPFATGTLKETSSVLALKQTQLAGTVAALTIEAYPVNTVVSTFHNSKTPEPDSIVDETIVPDTAQNNSADYDEYDSILHRRIKAAKILLFEDMSGSRQIRYVKESLDQAGYYYLDVGSAKGWFKNQLLNSQEWDLIIAASEARRPFGGEYFEYINDRVNRGSAAIIEFWDMDTAPNGKIKPFLDHCGIEFDSDWYEPDLRTFFWLQPDDEVLTSPNKIGNYLQNAEQLWFGDVGDLIKIKKRNGSQVGDALLLAGLNGSWKEDHGVLAKCLDGRVIYQSFSSHEYVMEDVIPLWQNYIYNTLFAKMESSNAEKEFIMGDNLIVDAQTQATLPIHQEDAGFIGEEFSCGEIIRGKILKEPIFEKDMFEHHADGVFILLDVELKNVSNYPIQIWDGDYSLEGELGDVKKTYKLDKAATGYLFIESPRNLSQDLIYPNSTYRTSLAFDIDKELTDIQLIISPGEEEEIPLCRVKILITE